MRQAGAGEGERVAISKAAPPGWCTGVTLHQGGGVVRHWVGLHQGCTAPEVRCCTSARLHQGGAGLGRIQWGQGNMLQKRELKSNLCNNWCSLSANSARSDFTKLQIANTHCERLVQKNIWRSLCWPSALLCLSLCWYDAERINKRACGRYKDNLDQTWDLSKNLHRQIFRPIILHP